MKNGFFILFFAFICCQNMFGQGFADEEEANTTTEIVIADTARLEINKAVFGIRESVEMKGGLKYNVKITQLKPLTYVVLKFQKAGMKLETKKYLANEYGMIELEFTLTKVKVGGVAVVDYVSSSGKTVTLKSRIKII